MEAFTETEGGYFPNIQQLLFIIICNDINK